MQTQNLHLECCMEAKQNVYSHFSRDTNVLYYYSIKKRLYKKDWKTNNDINEWKQL